MIIVFKPNIAKKDEAAVLKEIKRLGYRPHIMRGVARTVVGAIGDELTHKSLESLIALFTQVVESVMPVQKRFKLVSREAHPANSTINARGIVIGGEKFHVMAGPCSVESEKQLLTTAEAVKAAGATVLRGGAFKPRTSPYEFQGLGERGLKLLAKARRATGLAIITELLSEQRVDLVVTMCKGAVAMGADALLVEVHPNPAEAWSDGAQQLTLDHFARLMRELRPFIEASGRE